MKMGYEVWKSKLLSEKYLNGVRGAIPLAKEQFDILMRLIKMNSTHIGSFLDIGSGDGILSSVILESYPESKGVLVDISEFMISTAKEKLDAYLNNLDFVTYDYGIKDWVDKVTVFAPYDVIVSGLSIHHQPDERKRELYGEIFSLLKPGGIFINLEHVASATEWVSSIFTECFVDSLYEMSLKNNMGITRDRAQVMEDLYNRPDKEANILSPVDEQCKWLKEIGYKDVDCYFKIFEIAVFGGRKEVEEVQYK